MHRSINVSRFLSSLPSTSTRTRFFSTTRLGVCGIKGLPSASNRDTSPNSLYRTLVETSFRTPTMTVHLSAILGLPLSCIPHDTGLDYIDRLASLSSPASLEFGRGFLHPLETEFATSSTSRHPTSSLSFFLGRIALKQSLYALTSNFELVTSTPVLPSQDGEGAPVGLPEGIFGSVSHKGLVGVGITGQATVAEATTATTPTTTTTTTTTTTFALGADVEGTTLPARFLREPKPQPSTSPNSKSKFSKSCPIPHSARVSRLCHKIMTPAEMQEPGDVELLFATSPCGKTSSETELKERGLMLTFSIKESVWKALSGLGLVSKKSEAEGGVGGVVWKDMEITFADPTFQRGGIGGNPEITSPVWKGQFEINILPSAKLKKLQPNQTLKLSGLWGVIDTQEHKIGLPNHFVCVCVAEIN